MNLNYAMLTLSFVVSSDAEASFGIALRTMLWGGIFVGLGYFLRNPAVPIEARISWRAALLSLIALQGAAATDLNQAVGSLERAIDRCWAHPQRAAGRAAAPLPQIHHGAAAAPVRPPTELWLPSRGRAQASRHSCGRRRPKRRATPHR